MDISQLKRNKVNSDLSGKLPAGAYVCKIFNAKIVQNPFNGRDQIIFDVDIAEGEFANFFEKRYALTQKWDFSAQLKRYVTEENSNSLSYALEKFIDRLEKDNHDFQFEISMLADPTPFRGLTCAFTFREEEFITKDTGEIKIAVKIHFPQKVEDVREGKIKTPQPLLIPDDKRPDKQSNNSEFDGSDVPEAEVPF